MITEKQKHQIGNDLVNELVRTCPVDTGALKNSIWYSIEGDDIVISMKQYALHVEFGTLPHVIIPRYKKSLHWKNGNKDIFAMKVNHPGTRPQPFIRTAIKHKLPIILKRRLQDDNN